MAKRALCSSDQSDRTVLSASTPHCPKLWAMADGRKRPPRPLHVARQSGLPFDPTSKGIEAPLKHTNGNGSAASARKLRRRRPGKNARTQRAAVANAQAALGKAEREHAKRAVGIRDKAEALERKAQAEDARWSGRRNGSTKLSSAPAIDAFEIFPLSS